MNKHTRFAILSFFLIALFGYLGYLLGNVVGLLIGTLIAIAIMKWSIYPIIYSE